MDKEIIRLYTEEHLSAPKIASKLGIYRQKVYRVLWSNGIETRRSKVGYVDTTCASCGEKLRVPRYRYRKNGKKVFCDSKCYGQSRMGPIGKTMERLHRERYDW